MIKELSTKRLREKTDKIALLCQGISIHKNKEIERISK